LEGDVIVNFSDHEVNSGDELFRLLNKETIGIPSALTVIRKNTFVMKLMVQPVEKAA
jgi:S1-C subfamily serine protease